MKKLLITLSLFVGSLMGQELRVGMDLSYPPFETIDEEGQPQGRSVEMAQALAKYLGRPLVIENIPFIGLIPSLKTDKIDLAISSLSRTPERERVIDFSDPYLEAGLTLLVKIDSPINSIDQLDHPGKIVVVRQGTTGQHYAEKHLTKATLLVLDKESSCVLEVAQGKADAFIYDPFSLKIHSDKNSDKTRLVEPPFYKESWAIAMMKNSPLKEKVNTFLKGFKYAP